jgi:site-specific DNA-methyltransferase (adenine-specific)
MGAPRPVICVKPLKDIRKGNLHGASERREKLDYAYTEPATEEARMWAGWGTTLKPAWEPIILAMKPPEGTFAENALIWGVAGLNIDGCRIPAQGVDPYDSLRKSGRWPTNLLLSEDTLAAVQTQCPGAWRFFYCPKTKPAERNICGVNNEHPTIKPLALMRYLVRLTATPSGGVVLDPFMGSGTTGMACLMEGRQFIGIEINEGYFSIAIQRIRAVAAQLPLQEG